MKNTMEFELLTQDELMVIDGGEYNNGHFLWLRFRLHVGTNGEKLL